MKNSFWILFFVSIALTFSQVGYAQQKPLNEADYNIEVRFQRSYGTIGSDGSSNDPEPSWQVKVANDIDGIANDLLNNDPGIDNLGKYCYWLTTANNGWHPIQDTLLSFLQNNTTGKFDFEIMSYENDYSDQCIYHADPPGVDDINDDDNMDFIEGIHTFGTDINTGFYTVVEKQVNSDSKVELRYLWRYANGSKASPLDFGDINSCTQYLHANSNLKESPNTETHYTNDWSTADNPAFSSSEDVTYTFHNSRPRQLDFSASFDFDGLVHLVKVDNSGNLLSYIENSQSTLDTQIGVGYYALIFEGEESNGSNDPNGTFSFTVILNNIFSLGTPTFPDNIIYVNEGGKGTMDGSSWENASPDLYLALDASRNGTTKEIWVAKGVYFPGVCSNEKSNKFLLTSEIRLYGGFEGNEPANYDLNKRRGHAILSGNLGNFNSNSDNAFNVVELKNMTTTSIIDGFIIEKGWSPTTGSGGAGIIINTTSVNTRYNISNCVIRDNVANASNNASKGNGAGVFNKGNRSSIFFENCSFENNIAANSGGAFYNDEPGSQSSASFINCLFTGNEANQGGVVYNKIDFAERTTFIFVNSSFRNNIANFGSVLYQLGVSNAATANFYNSIFWNEPSLVTSNLIRNTDNTMRVTFDHCLIPYADCAAAEDSMTNGNLTCVNNLYNMDPQFISATNSKLARGSVARNSGDNSSYYLSYPTSDLQGRPRIAQTTIDIGPYESLKRIYVDSNAPENGNGTSWAHGYIYLQDALAEAEEIWVTKGTYKPSTALLRTDSYVIPDSTKLYGGFSGLEPSSFNLDQRDISLNQTILSGDIGIPNDNSDNTYNIIYTQNVSDQTILDGFTITGGNANAASGVNSAGGGWHNDGSGIGNSSSPSIVNCTFSSNFGINGGAFYNNGNYSNGTKPTYTNCLFFENSATNGAAIFNNYGDGLISPTIRNSTFANNIAISQGGAIMSSGSDGSGMTLIENAIFWGNVANGTLNSYEGDFEGENVPIDNSLVQEVNCIALNANHDGTIVCGAGMIFNQNPLFLDAPKGLFNLDCNSPAINEGTPTDAPIKDISGFLRTGNPDMGAYEFANGFMNNTIADGSNPTYNLPQITASGEILNTNNAFYKAQNSVILMPGFKVGPVSGAASVFRAEIGGGCP